MDPRKILGPVAAICFGIGAYQYFTDNKPGAQRIGIAALFSGLGAVSGGMYLSSLRNPTRNDQNERGQPPANRDDPTRRNRALTRNDPYSPPHTTNIDNTTTNIDVSDRRQIHIHYHDP